MGVGLEPAMSRDIDDKRKRERLAVLAVVVVVNLRGTFGQVRHVSSLRASDRLDLLVWVMTLVLNLLFNLDLGLVASIGFSLLSVIFRTQNPRCAVLGHIPEIDCYRNCRLYSEVTTSKAIPGLTIVSCSNPLYFASADLYFDALQKTVKDMTKQGIAVRLAACSGASVSSNSSSSPSHFSHHPSHPHLCAP
ncbi:prestin-like [Arapaima gigas]